MSYVGALLRGKNIAFQGLGYGLVIIQRRARFSGLDPFARHHYNIYRFHRDQDLQNCQHLLNRLSLPTFLSLRLINLGLIFGVTLVIAGPIYLLCPLTRPSAFKMVYWSLLTAGATFIKLGQWGAMRPDILSRELCEVLGQLHSKAPAHEMAWNRRLFRRDFGVDLEDVFAEFDLEPVGSGTIAQVHRARLKENGLEVAVKISHPGIDQLITRDLTLLLAVSRVLDSLPVLRWLNLGEEMRQFSVLMRQQLDLRYEAYTLGHFARNFSTWRTVHVPTPIPSLVSSGVLTETFVHGTSVGKFAARSFDHQLTEAELEVWTHVKKQLASVGLNSFLQMVLWDNFVHADLHPGNIMVRFVDLRDKRNPVKWSGPPSVELVHKIVNEDLEPQIVYLDTGLVTRLSRKDFRNFSDLFVTLVLRTDGVRAGELMIDRSPPRYQREVIDREGFCRALNEIVHPMFRDLQMDLGRFAMGSALIGVFDLVRKHHVHLDGAFTNLVMSFICVEGLGRQLAPDLNLLPFLARGALQYLATNVAFSI